MRVVVAVNAVREIGFRQTTALLIASLVRHGCEVHLADVDAFSFQGTAVEDLFAVNSVAIEASRDCDSHQIESWVRSEPPVSSINISPADMILIRTNPGRDPERAQIHDTFLDYCRTAKLAGMRVVNDPASVKYFASKAALGVLAPEFRPAMLVSHQTEILAGFVRDSLTDCVLKPLHGSRGQDVIRVNAGQAGLEELIVHTFSGRGVVAQHFVQSEIPGDQRVVVTGGVILEHGPYVAGIFRKPAAGDFRANLHAGGTAHQVALSDSARTAVESAAKILNAHGIWLAGIDLIGDKIIEFNVFSTGGLFDAIRFSRFDFADSIVERLVSV